MMAAHLAEEGNQCVDELTRSVAEVGTRRLGEPDRVANDARDQSAELLPRRRLR
jgi:hypothetical protein